MTTLEDLEALERALDQVMSLLTQASQNIEQAILAGNEFNQEHHHPVQSARRLHQAVTNIQRDLHEMLDQRTEVAAEIAQARTHAQ